MHRSPYLNLQGLVLAGEAVLRSGTSEQQRRFLPATASGELLWCQLFSEPGAGSKTSPRCRPPRCAMATTT